MFAKTKLALAAMLMLGAASAVQAASDNDGGNATGGYRVGPMGQHLSGANPVYHHSLRCL
jgi:Spy/CpxP family protein refolding chaperone